MSRLSIRAKVAAGFAAGLLLVLALTGAFVYLRVAHHLDDALDDALESRAHDLAALVGHRGGRPLRLGPGAVPRVEVKEGFSQVVTPQGRVIASTLRPGQGPALDRRQIELAARRSVTLHVRVPGVEGEVEMVARPARSSGRRFVVVTGASTDDRNEALADLRRTFLIGTPLAIVLASGLGYLLAGRFLSPVEAMRRRAGEISLQRNGERLPVPRAEDEIHALGETLNMMLDRIEAGLERQRVFVADASHELRTPLAIVAAELELADNPERSREDLRRAVRSAAEEIERLSRLADDLLVMARFDQDRLAIGREPVPARDLLGRVRARFARRAEKLGREITLETADDLVIDVDRFRIEQALGNLLDNALRHGGGTVGLAARRDADAVVFEVSDQGDGFPQDFEGEAFERFARGDESRSGGGVGLGLAIVRAIAVAHGGEARIVTGPGGAATILRITVPIAD